MVTCPGAINGIKDRTPCGSESSSPPYVEYSTPPYIKWAHDFSYLMEDPKGIELFQRYLDDEEVGDCLRFWLACEGIKKNNDKCLKKKWVNVIYKKFIKSSIIKLSDSTRNTLLTLKDFKKDNQSQDELIDDCIFDDAQKEIEELMTSSFYRNFLKSEIYLQYLQEMQNDCLSPTLSTTSNVNANANVNQNQNLLHDNNNEKVNSPLQCSTPPKSSSTTTMTTTSNVSVNVSVPLPLPPSSFPQGAIGFNMKDDQMTEQMKQGSGPGHGLVPVPAPREKKYGVLPTVDENCELNNDLTELSESLMYNCRVRKQNGMIINVKNPDPNEFSNQNHTNQMPNLKVNNPHHLTYLQCKLMSNPPNPFHVNSNIQYTSHHVKYASYLPNSAQESDASSSFTNASDTSDKAHCTSRKSYIHKFPKQKLIKQKETDIDAMKLIPRTQKINPDAPGFKHSNLAANHPKEFHKLLCEKLNKHLLEVQNDTYVRNALVQVIEDSNHGNHIKYQNSLSGNGNGITAGHKPSSSSLRDVIKQQQIVLNPTDDTDSILDQHMKRVFEPTPNTTPNGTKPGFTSPHYVHQSNNCNNNIGNSNPNSSNPTSSVKESNETITIGYKYSTEKVPYIIKISGQNITLKKFKQHISAKKGNWKFYFKKKCEYQEFGTEYVFEEINNDNEILPICDGKISAKIEQIM